MSLVQFDRQVLLFIQRHRPEPLNRFFVLLTYSGTGWAWFIMATVLNVLNLMGIRYVGNQGAFLRSLFAPLLAWVLSSILKKRFSRRRPFIGVEGLSPLIQTPTCGSFPSSHSAASFALFFALLLAGHPLATWIGVWATLVSFSRVYLGVHYSSDVGGGLILGFLSALVINIVM